MWICVHIPYRQLTAWVNHYPKYIGSISQQSTLPETPSDIMNLHDVFRILVGYFLTFLFPCIDKVPNPLNPFWIWHDQLLDWRIVGIYESSADVTCERNPSRDGERIRGIVYRYSSHSHSFRYPRQSKEISQDLWAIRNIDLNVLHNDL